jgi:hypothetical protein
VADAPKAYLQGGPCDGKIVELTAAETDSASVYCKGAWYRNPGTGKRRDGALIFVFAGKPPGPGGPIKAPKAHGGWTDVRKSVNRHMPAGLRRSQRKTRAALRTLSRARRVRL